MTDQTPLEYWEDRYGGDAPVWSGRVNATLAAVVGALKPGQALELGCGEGGDAIWLAQNGWRVTAVDISPTAIARARTAATDRGIDESQVRWVTADLASWSEPDGYDLVTASFLHSDVELPRTEILRNAASQVAPGGRLLIISHASRPPWAPTHEQAAHEGEGHHHHHDFKTPAEEIDALELADGQWETALAETRMRQATGPDGQEAELEDGVVLLVRR